MLIGERTMLDERIFIDVTEVPAHFGRTLRPGRIAGRVGPALTAR
jgi:hypothetical protein